LLNCKVDIIKIFSVSEQNSVPNFNFEMRLHLHKNMNKSNN